jgi:hypothetical protein
MKTIFDTITVNYAEYSYFKGLKQSERVGFFFELYEAAIVRYANGGLDLSSFFKALKQQIEDAPDGELSQPIEWPDGVDHVEVMIDDENIMIESNSLKAARHIIYKFFESGYILRRDKEMEKSFKRDKVTKYLRIFNIVDQTSSICIN